jgi:hypothetical protein
MKRHGRARPIVLVREGEKDTNVDLLSVFLKNINANF